MKRFWHRFVGCSPPYLPEDDDGEWVGYRCRCGRFFAFSQKVRENLRGVPLDMSGKEK